MNTPEKVSFEFEDPASVEGLPCMHVCWTTIIRARAFRCDNWSKDKRTKLKILVNCQNVILFIETTLLYIYQQVYAAWGFQIDTKHLIHDWSGRVCNHSFIPGLSRILQKRSFNIGQLSSTAGILFRTSGNSVSRNEKKYISAYVSCVIRKRKVQCSILILNIFRII
jgi:hypothetical protein